MILNRVGDKLMTWPEPDKIEGRKKSIFEDEFGFNLVKVIIIDFNKIVFDFYQPWEITKLPFHYLHSSLPLFLSLFILPIFSFTLCTHTLSSIFFLIFIIIKKSWFHCIILHHGITILLFFPILLLLNRITILLCNKFC